MTNQNQAVEVEVSKKRRAPLKAQKTGAEIVAEIEILKEKVAELDKALVGLDHDGAAYAIVKEAFTNAHDELATVLSKVHFS